MRRKTIGTATTLLLACMLIPMLFHVNSIFGYEARNVLVGVYPGGQRVWEYEQQLDVKFAHVLQFQNVKNLNYSKIIPYLDRGYDVILNIEFFDTYANLHDVGSGKYDTYLTELADDIKRDGRTIWIRPLHEFNGDWYNWGVLYPGNLKEDFVPAWKHVVQVFKQENAPVKFQLNYNRYNGKDDKTPFSVFWPGDYWVDMTVITNYNRAYTDQWHQYWHSFSEDFNNAYNQVTALTQKPIGVAEMSSTSHGGNKPQWIIDAFKSITYDYPKIQQITWFLLNKIVGGVSWDWDLNTEEERNAFKQGVNIMKNTYAVLADSFESVNFSKWSGKTVTYGETAYVSNTRAYQGKYSARFASDGGSGYERAHCYKAIAGLSQINARGYFYVTQSGIADNGDQAALIMFRAGTNNVAWAGWRKTAGAVKWFLMIRDGTGYVKAFSSTSPSLYKWYGVELHWEKGTASGSAELWVNGARICAIGYKNTAAFGDVSHVRFGLGELYNSGAMALYGDAFTIYL